MLVVFGKNSFSDDWNNPRISGSQVNQVVLRGVGSHLSACFLVILNRTDTEKGGGSLKFQGPDLSVDLSLPSWLLF